MHHSLRRLGATAPLFGLLAVALATSGETACKSTEPARGALMLAVTTDMAAPKDIDSVGLYVKSAGRELFALRAPVSPNGEVRLPATIAILAPEDPKVPIKLRIVAFSGTTARVLRDVTSIVPQNRTALLRVTLSFLSYGSGSGEVPLSAKSAAAKLAQHPLSQSAALGGSDKLGLSDFDAFTELRSRCAEGTTDVGGECVKLDFSDPSVLDDFDATAVFGGGTAPKPGEDSTGECFPVDCCFASAQPVVPDGDCTIASLGSKTNIGLRTQGLGTATALGPIVPLDFDAVPAFGEVGVAVTAGSRLQLPRAVCAKLAASTPKEEQVVQIVGSTTCAPKSKRTPLCSPASATKIARCGDVILPPNDGGLETSVDAPDPFAIETLVSDLDAPNGLASVGSDVYVADVGIKIRKISVKPAVTIVARTEMGNPVGLVGMTRAGVPGLWTAGDTHVGWFPISGAPLVLESKVITFIAPPDVFTPLSVGALGELPLVQGSREFLVRLKADNTLAFSGFASTFPAISDTGDLRLGSTFGELYTCPTVDPMCTRQLLEPSPRPNDPGGFRALQNVATRTYLLWTPSDGSSPGQVYRYDPAATPSIASLVAATTPKPINNYGGIAANAKHVYYASDGILYAVPVAGGPPKRIAPVTGPGYELGLGSVHVNGAHVYWLSRGNGQDRKGSAYRRLIEP